MVYQTAIPGEVSCDQQALTQDLESPTEEFGKSAAQEWDDGEVHVCSTRGLDKDEQSPQITDHIIDQKLHEAGDGEMCNI